MPRARAPRRWWRWPLYVALAVAVLLALLFVALRTSFARELVRQQVNSGLAPLFQGKIEIDRIGQITLWGVSGVDARVLDAEGKPVIWARGLEATASLPGLGWQLLAHGDAPELYIASVRVAHADVTLRENEELGVSLAAAFLPRSTETSAPASPPESGPRLQIAQVSFGSIWVHGRASGSPPIDAELRHLVAGMRQSPVDGFSLELRGVELLVRGLPSAVDLRAHVTGGVEAPANDSGPLRLELALDGRANAAPLSLEVSWVGDDLYARLLAARVPASFVNERAPGLALDGELTLLAEVEGPLPQLDFEAEVDSTAAHVTAAGYAVVASGLELVASVDAKRLDLARLVAGGPPSDIDLQATALLLEGEDGHYLGSHRLDIAPSRLAGQRTPSLWLTGRDDIAADASVRVSGKLGASEPRLSVRGAYQLALPSSGEGVVTATVDAEFDDPDRLAALGVRAGGKASLSGELRPEQGRLSAKAALSLRHLDYLALKARNVELQASAAGTLEDPRVHAAVSLDLLSGRAHADLDYSATEQKLDVFAADLRLAPLLESIGSPLPLERANLDLDAHVTRSARSPKYWLNMTAGVDLAKLGAVKLAIKDFELPSSPPNMARVAKLEGEVALTGKLDLEAVLPLVTSAGLPIERTTGSLRFELGARHRRGDAQGLELSLLATTNGLRVVGQRAVAGDVTTTADAIASKPMVLEGLDLHLSTRTTPSNGDLVGTLIVRDPGGTLAEVQAEAKLAGLLPAELTNAAKLSHVPLKMTLEVPTRRLRSLPAIIRPPALRGSVSLEASLDGSLAEPSVKGRVLLPGLRASGAKEPIDVAADIAGGFGGGSVKVDAKLVRTQAALLTLAGRWQGDLRRAAELAQGSSGLTGGADVELIDFPLDVVPQILDRQVDGRLSGKLKLIDWGRNARVDVSLRSTTLSVAKMPVKDFSLVAKNEVDRIVAELGMKVGSGTAKATLDADARWGPRALPELGHRGTAKLAATAFKLETLSPLLGAYISEIGGVLDANTEVTVTPNATRVSGAAQLEKGVMQLPALGQRFSDISARVVVADGQFEIERLEARGTTGRVTVKGGARLDGFELREANAQLTIAKRESLPIMVEGEALGDAWGHVNAVFKNPPQGERSLDVELPDFHITTPETGGGGLQDLANDDDIAIGVKRSDGKFVALAVQPLQPGGKQETASSEPPRTLRIQVRFGNNVVVERGRTAEAHLAGQLVILSGAQTDVTGRIELRGGKLDVSGKTFELERGVITFEGNDPGNPTITATARWDAPGYAVYADYVGDVQNGRIKLHSEPPLTQDEIASLLLFGSPEGSSAGSSDPNAASLALGVAGGTATQGLNQVLDDFTNLDVSARIDTTTGSARPELVFQVSQRVSAKVTRAVGAPAAGESPDRTFLTLELRLKRAWALSAVFGDRGASALDLIWRRRY